MRAVFDEQVVGDQCAPAWPIVDLGQIRAHVTAIHGRAAPLAGKGILIVAAYGEDPVSGKKIRSAIRHVKIGDVEGNVRAIAELAKSRFANVYMPLNVMRPDLALVERGKVEDIVAVLGLVADLDRADGKMSAEFPVEPSFVIESSPGNFQPGVFFDRPLEAREAAPIAEVLWNVGGGDAATKDVCHVWRVPGTFNWPNVKKVRNGRSPDPVLSRLTQKFGGLVYDQNTLCARLASAEPAPKPGNGDGNFERRTNGALPPPIETMTGILEHLVERGFFEKYSGNETDADGRIVKIGWLECGMSLKLAYGAGGEDLWAVTHRDEEAYGAASAKWESFASEPLDSSVTIGTLIKAARSTGFKFQPRAGLERSEGAVTGAKSAKRDDADGSERPDSLFSDDDLALRFAARHADDLRYVAAWNKWLRFDGTHWRLDDTLHAFDLVRRVCREAAQSCRDKQRAAVASARTVAAVTQLARADGRLAATVDQWDADSWLLNTPAGVFDLRTGQKRQHRPEDYLTNITAVAPGGDCPLFLNFLDRIMDSDSELIAYLRRVLGYGLTGDTREQALFFAYGTGANGKSVLLSTVAGILGSYHRTAPTETFVASNNNQHPTELARLRGARLVTATETEEGRRWAESRIKQLTGGDTIAARFMHQDFFEFRPRFKLIIAGNHRPSLRSVDEAIRRRLHLIPFAVTIPAEERDGKLTEKLKAEWPGILAWMIAGALQWKEQGLQPPPAVLSATAQYLSAEDAIGVWIEECCRREADGWAPTIELFASWTRWAEKAGEPVGTLKNLVQTIESRGYGMKRKATARGFQGLVPDSSVVLIACERRK